jgi:hypothetical protein
MGTRSRIGIENQDGTVTSSYVHWDGYLSHVGHILHTSYTTEEKIRELMALGDLSSLGKEIGHKQSFDQPTDRNWCLAYGRDRGETDTEAQLSDNIEAYLKLAEEYTYLWSNGEWLVLSEDVVPEWISLEEALRMDSLHEDDSEE